MRFIFTFSIFVLALSIFTASADEPSFLLSPVYGRRLPACNSKFVRFDYDVYLHGADGRPMGGQTIRISDTLNHYVSITADKDGSLKWSEIYVIADFPTKTHSKFLRVFSDGRTEIQKEFLVYPYEDGFTAFLDGIVIGPTPDIEIKSQTIDLQDSNCPIS